MDNLAGFFIMLFVYGSCALLFYGIGAWADRMEKPMGFWSGSTVKAEWVRDIPQYNHENAVMWKIYSIPYFLCCVLNVFGLFYEVFTYISVGLLIAACFPGIFFLVAHYRKIEKKYIVKPTKQGRSL